jgi:hypothetical protein
LENFFEDLKKTSKAKRVEFGEGGIEVVESLKVKIIL